MKGGIHSFVSSISSFLWDNGEPRYEQNKIGYQISRIRKTVLLQFLQKKCPAQKRLFLVTKNVFFVIFFFSYLKRVFSELMLLELDDLLGLSLLRNFFSAARSIFLVNIAQYFQFF